MSKKKTKMSVWVDAATWETFKQGVLAKWGKLHAALGDELESAIKAYTANHLSHPPYTHARVQFTQRGLKTVKMIMDRINLKFEKEVTEKDVELAIRHEVGNDNRTIRNYKQTLKALGWLEVRVLGSKMSNQQTIYSIHRPSEKKIEALVKKAEK